MAREMLSPHFAKDECVCRCGCGLCNATPRLLSLADKVRDLLRQPMIVTSVCRCREHNAKVGGSPTSKHLAGKAMEAPVAAGGLRRRRPRLGKRRAVGTGRRGRLRLGRAHRHGKGLGRALEDVGP